MEKKEKLKKIKKDFFKKFLNIYLKKILPLKYKIIFDKSSTVSSFFVTQFFYIHNGNVFRRLHVTNFLVGCKFGTFVITKKPFKYLLKKKKR